MNRDLRFFHRVDYTTTNPRLHPSPSKRLMPSARQGFALGSRENLGVGRTRALPFLPNLSTGWDDRPWNDHCWIAERTPANLGELCRQFKQFLKESGIKRAALAPVNEWDPVPVPLFGKLRLPR